MAKEKMELVNMLVSSGLYSKAIAQEYVAKFSLSEIEDCKTLLEETSFNMMKSGIDGGEWGWM